LGARWAQYGHGSPSGTVVSSRQPLIAWRLIWPYPGNPESYRRLDKAGSGANLGYAGASMAPAPIDGLLSLVCSWPEVGLPETQTDLLLPDLAVRAAETFRIWDLQAPGADG